MRMIIDAMGGDNAPQEIVRGALRAKTELGVDITLVGRREDVLACLSEEEKTQVTVVDAREVPWRTNPPRRPAARRTRPWRLRCAF